MTMRSHINLVCSCGHHGAIKIAENDQPHSKIYESYSLENLDGGKYRLRFRLIAWNLGGFKTNMP
jgi:hypothetical protein